MPSWSLPDARQLTELTTSSKAQLLDLSKPLTDRLPKELKTWNPLTATLAGAALLCATAKLARALRGSKKGKRGRRALVTGAASGIGRVTALKLAQEGWRVWACDMNTEGLESLAKLAGPSVSAHKLDVTDAAQCEALVAEIGKDGGNLDALVNIAGLVQPGPVLVPEKAMRGLFEVNTFGAIRLCRLSVPLLLKSPQGGSIVNLTSCGGKVAFPNSGCYSATKAAVELFSDALRRDALACGLPLRVTYVSPGPVSTPLAAAFPARLRAWCDANPKDPFYSGCAKQAAHMEWLIKMGLSVEGTVGIEPALIADIINDTLDSYSPPAYILVCSFGYSIIDFLARWLPTPLADLMLVNL